MNFLKNSRITALYNFLLRLKTWDESSVILSAMHKSEMVYCMFCISLFVLHDSPDFCEEGEYSRL